MEKLNKTPSKATETPQISLLSLLGVTYTTQREKAVKTQNKSQNNIEALTQAIRDLTEEVRHLTQTVSRIPGVVEIQANTGGVNQMGNNNTQEPFKAD